MLDIAIFIVLLLFGVYNLIPQMFGYQQKRVEVHNQTHIHKWIHHRYYHRSVDIH
jgi:hypothetical protein